MRHEAALTCPDGRSGGRRLCVRCGLVCVYSGCTFVVVPHRVWSFQFDLGPGRMASNHHPAVLETAALAYLSYAGKNWRGAGVEPASQESPPVSSLDEPRCEATPGSNRGRPRMPRACVQASDDGPSLPCRWPQVTTRHHPCHRCRSFILRGTTRDSCRCLISPRLIKSSRVGILRGRPSTMNS